MARLCREAHVVRKELRLREVDFNSDQRLVFRDAITIAPCPNEISERLGG